MRTVHIEGNGCVSCHRAPMGVAELVEGRDIQVNSFMPPHDPGSMANDYAASVCSDHSLQFDRGRASRRQPRIGPCLAALANRAASIRFFILYIVKPSFTGRGTGDRSSRIR